MAIYYQNFESFAVGATTPLGSFATGSGVIVADNFLPTGSRACKTQNNLTNIVYSDGATLYTSASMFVAWKWSEANPQPIVQYDNGTSNFSPLFTLHGEFDNTLSFYSDNNGTFVGNSGDFSTHLNKWLWLQINTTFLDVVIGTGTGTHVLAIAYELGVDGTSVMSGTTTTHKLISGMNSGTPQFDHITLGNSSIWDEFTLSTLTSINTYPNPGTPKARASTALIEPIELIDSAKVRATTGLIEVLISDKNMHVQEA